ncbi:MAG: hypothetical protein Kow0090_19710 [Myxococcota bacterium]
MRESALAGIFIAAIVASPNYLFSQPANSVSDGDEIIVVMDEESPATETTLAVESPATPSLMALEIPYTPPETAEPTSDATAFLFSGDISTNFAGDVLWDDRPENVIDWQNKAKIALSGKPSEESKVFVEGRFFHRALAEREMEDCLFVLQSGEGCRNEYEVTPGEIYYDYYFSIFDIRLGNQVFKWTSLDGQGVLDVLNPRDFRYSPFDSDNKMPVLAARLNGYLGDLTASLVYIPFFSPHKFRLFGDDFSLLQDDVPSPLPLEIEELKSLFHPSVMDKFQETLATELPDESLDNSSFAVRLQYPIFNLELSAVYYYGFERTPRLLMDDSVRNALAAFKDARELSGGGFAPIGLGELIEEQNQLADALRTINQKLIRGEEVIRAYHPRTQLAGLGLFYIYESFTFKAEGAFIPRMTLYYSDYTPLYQTVVQSGGEITYEYGEPLSVTVGSLQSFLPERPAKEILLFEERDMNVGLYGNVKSQFLRTTLELSATAIYNLWLNDVVAKGYIQYKATDRHIVKAGVMFFYGPDPSEKLTPGGAFDKNDFVFGEYRYVF